LKFGLAELVTADHHIVMVSVKSTEPVIQEIVRRAVESFHPLRIILLRAILREGKELCAAA